MLRHCKDFDVFCQIATFSPCPLFTVRSYCEKIPPTARVCTVGGKPEYHLYTVFVSISMTSNSIVSPSRQTVKIIKSPTSSVFFIAFTSSVVVTG